MAAASTDKFAESTTNDRPNAATLTAVKASAATSLTCDSTTGWPTDTAVHFTMYEVDAEGVKDASTQRDYKGIVNSSTTINNITVRGGADREFPIGAKVICAPTAAWADDLVGGLLVSHDQDGTLKDDSVVTANITDANVTTAKLADASVTNAKLSTTAGEVGGAWASWTPTYTNITVGNGTVTAKYLQVGKTVHFRFRILCGSTTVLGNGILISLPVTASSEYGSANTSDPIGKCTASDSSALRYPGDAVISDTDRSNLQLFFYTDTTTRYTSTFPFTEAINDALVVTGTYEAA